MSDATPLTVLRTKLAHSALAHMHACVNRLRQQSESACSGSHARAARAALKRMQLNHSSQIELAIFIFWQFFCGALSAITHLLIHKA